MQEASSTKISSVYTPYLGPIPEDSTENLVAIPKELRMLIFSHLNASSRELSANVCRTWRAEVIHLELIQFRKWVHSLAEILNDPSLNELIAKLRGDLSSVEELTGLKDSLYSTLAMLPIEKLRCFLTMVLNNDIFIDTRYLSSKVMAFFKNDSKTLFNFTALVLDFVDMGYVEKSWEAVEDIPLNDFEMYQIFVENLLKKGNADKVGDIATLHYTNDKKIELIQILLGTTKIASLYEINLKVEEIESLSLRIAASLHDESQKKWSETIEYHFQSWRYLFC